MKVYAYLILTIGLTLLLHFAGINNTDSAVIRVLGVGFEENTSSSDYGVVTSANVSAGGFYNTLFDAGSGGILALLIAGGALVIGLYKVGFSMETAVVIPFIVGTMVLFVETFVNLFSYGIATGNNLISAITVLIFVPLTAGYIFSLIEFIRGTD
jgi:hypothetical protein